MMLKSFFIIAAIMFQASAFAANGPRTVFIQMFEWPWKDVAKECEIYLGPAGFSAVQVSPPHEHIIWGGNPWWERYQVVSYKLESRSGNEAEFIDMVQRCKNAGVDIYVDAVINHMTGIPGGIGIAGSRFSHYDYPGIYSYQDFHHCGLNGNDDIRNYDNRWEVQNCELLDLADLATESDYVRSKIAEYLNHLLDLGVAGFRFDAAKHIPATDLKAIADKLKRPAYLYSEFIYSPTGEVQYPEYLPVGDVMAYSYSESIASAIRSNNVGNLRFIADPFPFASSDAITFLTNHDLERGQSVLSYNWNEGRSYILAQVFLLAWPYGYPQLYSGYKFTDREVGPPMDATLHTLPILDDQNNCRAPWTCEHRHRTVAAMVDFRNQTVGSFSVQNWWTNNRDMIAFSRGRQGFVMINFGGDTFNGDLATALPDGTYCNVFDKGYSIQDHSCTDGYAVENGRVKLAVGPQSAVVLLRKSQVMQKSIRK